ncbi:hypothetical protein BgAZ_207400 [Babesia gibsoni]|uniref:Secreted antigen 1 n=3 Tax=Babesia gibsoni TaxID=33632 RepID=A0P8W7_BABGI|nr:hypothetical protein BgAZ_207400 [Babesia gibsoni]BAF37282.1 secreted antigen 1 [Babesia gibsoni]
MAAFRFFHSVVWWSLVLSVSVSATQITTPVDDNDSAPMEPHSVKDMLDFLAKLQQENTLKDKFVNDLEKVVKEYLDTTKVEKKGYTEVWRELLDNVNKLRHELLNNTGDYGKYKDLNEEGVTKAFEILVQWIPLLHSEFWLLYQLSSSEGQGLGGNQWAEEHFGPGHTDTHVHKWLTDNIGEAMDKFSVKKGFTEEDLKTDGRLTAKVTGNLGINFYAGGPLNYAQYGIFLLHGDTFLASNLASAMLFLAEFCRQINADKLKDKINAGKYACVKDVCKDLVNKIDDLHKHILPLYNPLTAAELENDEAPEGTAVRKATGYFHEMYKGKLQEDKFEGYLKWIVGNIAKVMLLLREMHADSARWTVEDLLNVQSRGPFKYGYTFLNNRWDQSIFYEFKHAIDNLALFESSNGLFCLLRCLDGQRASREREVFEKLEEEKKKKEQVDNKVRRATKRKTEVEEGEGGSSGKQTPVPTPPTGKTQLKEQTLADGHSEDQRHKDATKQTSETVLPAHQTTPEGPPTAKEASFSAYSLRVVTALLALLSII